ncbi:AbrB/MazE/SpoVT family DNA-binding domain-containing protein [Candidatus Woesearchaeota archaeon]|nr:AbrB/MazE/SpoVT family DNA-binding domain-containing protein [Candidatus Woesearchaeota archaeon]
MVEKCPQCKSGLKNVIFDVGFGVNVESLHCQKCGFNITEDSKLNNAMSSLREQMAKEVKVIRVGTGLGIRFPNEVVKSFSLKQGGEVTLKPEEGGIKLVVGS